MKNQAKSALGIKGRFGFAIEVFGFLSMGYVKKRMVDRATVFRDMPLGIPNAIVLHATLQSHSNTALQRNYHRAILQRQIVFYFVPPVSFSFVRGNC